MSIDYSKVPSPCFVLEEARLIDNLRLIHDVQKRSKGKIILALKGFSMYHVFPLVKQYLSGAAASSLNEARLIYEEMNCLAHTYAPVFDPKEFDELLGYSSHITFNSIKQFETYQAKVDKHASSISMGLRINPRYSEVETAMYNPCLPGSRLGVNRKSIGETLPKGIEGLHFHSLCENDSFTLENTLSHVEQDFGDLLPGLKWLNLGGGHLMTREGYNLEHLIKQIERLRETYDLEVILEPGSAIAWETGVLKTTVLDIVDSQGIMVALLDVSFAAHMPDTLEMPYKPRIQSAYQSEMPGKFNYRMGGSTCLAGDFIGDYAFDDPLEIGDTLIFEDMMHYTMGKTTGFNGVQLPSIGSWKTSNEFVLHKHFGYDIFKDRL